MNDMNTFERAVAGEVVREMGPSRPVDPSAVFAAAVTNSSSKWTLRSMLSATKFVVAGAIVALFGGLLLAGVLTQPGDERLPPAAASASAVTQAGPTDAPTSEPDPTTEIDADVTTSTPVLLPGVDLVTEEVEPGVYRIVEDGHRELSRPAEGEGHLSTARRSNLTVGQDGSVWIFGPERFFRLGDPRAHASDEATPAYVGAQVEVGPDGVIWARDRLPAGPERNSEPGRGLRSFDGTSWEVRRDDATAFDVAPDGTVWAYAGGMFQHLGADGWAAVGGAGYGGSGYEGTRRFWVGPQIHESLLSMSMEPDPEVGILNWPERCPHDPCGPVINVYGTAMDSFPHGGLVSDIRGVDMGDDGDYWVLQHLTVPLAGRGDFDGGMQPIDYLVHVEGGPMTVYTTAEGVPGAGYLYREGAGAALRSGPDGSVWLTLGRETFEEYGDGVARFDGQTWSRFLRETCVYALDVGPDGTAWVQGGTCDDSEIGPVETYAITPEAVAAAE